MRHPWKKLFNIKCLSPLRGVQDPGIQYEPPEIAKGLGKGLREFKRASEGIAEDEERERREQTKIK